MGNILFAGFSTWTYNVALKVNTSLVVSSSWNHGSIGYIIVFVEKLSVRTGAYLISCWNGNCVEWPASRFSRVYLESTNDVNIFNKHLKIRWRLYLWTQPNIINIYSSLVELFFLFMIRMLSYFIFHSFAWYIYDRILFISISSLFQRFFEYIFLMWVKKHLRTVLK